MTYLYIDLMSVEMNGYIHVDTKYSNKEILSCGMTPVTFGMLKKLKLKKP